MRPIPKTIPAAGKENAGGSPNRAGKKKVPDNDQHNAAASKPQQVL